MKYRILPLLLCLSLLLSGLGIPACAAVDYAQQLEVVHVLGIMVGDENGNMELEKPVTRAQFAKMLVASSGDRDAVSDGTGASLFTDVKTGHWAGGYIALAVEKGWLVGYVDGSFRPERTITLEEGCTALLRVLGYDASTLAGAYPTAQLQKAQSVGLRDDLSVSRGQTLTRRDCVTLLYNLLTSQTQAGQIYGTALGCTVKNGEVEYNSLITSGTKGPYVVEDSALILPFAADTATVYFNGEQASAASVVAGDVYYYHENLRTVWVYRERVTGTLTGVTPNRVTPSSVTVSGAAYELETSAAAYQVSAQGTFREGDTVTLLLGMNNTVVKILPASTQEEICTGLVLSSTTSSATESTGGDRAESQIITKIVTADGVERTYYHSGPEYEQGTVVTVTVTPDGTDVFTAETGSLSGTVGAAGASFAGYRFAAEADILDTDGDGGYKKIYPQRLKGCSLSTEHVRWYSLNEKSEIDGLILQNVTGDVWDYAYITAASSRSSGLSVSASYTYIMEGRIQSVSGSTKYPVTEGGAVLQDKGGQLERMYQLTSTEVSYITGQTAGGSGRTLTMAENVQVVLCEKDVHGNLLGYYPTELEQIDTRQYTVTAWYDSFGCPAGGRVRILVAQAKA